MREPRKQHTLLAVSAALVTLPDERANAGITVPKALNAATVPDAVTVPGEACVLSNE
jgi:hypothetical protein